MTLISHNAFNCCTPICHNCVALNPYYYFFGIFCNICNFNKGIKQHFKQIYLDKQMLEMTNTILWYTTTTQKCGCNNLRYIPVSGYWIYFTGLQKKTHNFSVT